MQKQRLLRNHPDQILIGLVSVSDRASSGTYEDQGIPALEAWLGDALTVALIPVIFALFMMSVMARGLPSSFSSR